MYKHSSPKCKCDNLNICMLKRQNKLELSYPDSGEPRYTIKLQGVRG
jgi:hypothetical protein